MHSNPNQTSHCTSLQLFATHVKPPLVLSPGLTGRCTWTLTIEPLFVAAGWDLAAQLSQPQKAFPSSQLQVAEILRRFGGMRVGQSGPGTEQAASDICFYSSLRPEVDVVISPWLPKVGKCAAFGTAHNHHMILFVNDEGTYFAITDPDERLYKLDGAFGQVMQNLLCGYRFGAPLAREA